MRWLLVILLLFGCTTSKVNKSVYEETFSPRLYYSQHTLVQYGSGFAMQKDTTRVLATVSLWIISYQGIDHAYPIQRVTDNRIFVGDFGKIELNENRKYIIVYRRVEGTYMVWKFIEQIWNG